MCLLPTGGGRGDPPAAPRAHSDWLLAEGLTAAGDRGRVMGDLGADGAPATDGLTRTGLMPEEIGDDNSVPPWPALE